MAAVADHPTKGQANRDDTYPCSRPLAQLLAEDDPGHALLERIPDLRNLAPQRA
jgi:hypothetical protein